MRGNLDRFPRRPIDDASLKPAAVAIVVVIDGGEEHRGPAFLVTRRGGRMRSHRGQWALPGGRVDPGETHVDTARRELEEERHHGLLFDGEVPVGDYNKIRLIINSLTIVVDGVGE